MAQELSSAVHEPCKAAVKSRNDCSAQRGDREDGAYPSSESDAELGDPTGVTREAKPLLSDDPSHLQDEDKEHKSSTPHTGHERSHSRSTSPAPTPFRGRRKSLKRSEYIWICLTLTLIATLGYSSQLCIMLPYFHKTPSFAPWGLAAVLIPFNLGLTAIFYNYYLCIFTDPGTVPPGWQPDWSALHPPTTPSRGESQSIELKETILRPRYCKRCQAYKPPRSHHCKTCRRCILRMDHHCPWLANCVGHFNYPHFIRFLLFVDVTCFYHLVMISCRVLDNFNTYTYWREPGGREIVWLVANYALCIPVLVLVGVFSGYHFYCVASNQTTIEAWEKDRVATMVRRGRVRKLKYPYDLGVWRNVRSVMGDNVFTWCLPGKAMGGKGEGVWYETADGIDEGAQYRWPPKDPSKSNANYSSSHGWAMEDTQAPPLFPSYPSNPTTPVLPPGATSSSPFTYGSGFNPNLRPTNSSSLRFRGPNADAVQNSWLRETEKESEGSSISSGSDDELEIAAGCMPNFAEPSADQLDIAANYNHGQYYGSQHEEVFEDEYREEDKEDSEE
ncbi:related to PFA4-Palmitoyltransferase (N-terminal fragment), partial [Ustilago hordei]